MKLSELLEKYRIEEKFEVKNEKNFDTLALTQSDINGHLLQRTMLLLATMSLLMILLWYMRIQQ